MKCSSVQMLLPCLALRQVNPRSEDPWLFGWELTEIVRTHTSAGLDCAISAFPSWWSCLCLFTRLPCVGPQAPDSQGSLHLLTLRQHLPVTLWKGQDAVFLLSHCESADPRQRGQWGFSSKEHKCCCYRKMVLGVYHDGVPVPKILSVSIIQLKVNSEGLQLQAQMY